MTAAQKRASDAYRKRLAESGLKRFEIRAPAEDRELIRALAGKLAKGDAEAARVRAELTRSVGTDDRPRGGVWAALRRAPPEVAELVLEREEIAPRDVDL